MNTKIYTQEEFDEFKRLVDEVITHLGVTGWVIDIQYRLLDNAKARTYMDVAARTACICLTTAHNYDYNEGMTLPEIALHEVLHILLTDFSMVVEKLGDANHDLVIAKEHELIHRLVKAFTTK